MSEVEKVGLTFEGEEEERSEIRKGSSVGWDGELFKQFDSSSTFLILSTVDFCTD